VSGRDPSIVESTDNKLGYQREALMRHSVSLSQADKVLLLHLPRTGGTTLSHRLFKVFAPAEILTDFAEFKKDAFGHVLKTEFERYIRTLPPDAATQCRLFSGHLPFGFHHTTPGRFRYVSFLRNPVDRAISGFLYGNAKLFPDDKEWLKFALHLSISAGANPGFDNPATRVLTGSEVLVPTSPEITTWDLPPVVDADRDVAIEALRRDFCFVGITERFEDSCRLLFRLLEKDYSPSGERLNETRLNLTRDDLPPTTLRLMERHLRHDIALYAAACAQFNVWAERYGCAPAEPYLRLTQDAGPISSGDHAHIVSADYAFGDDSEGAWLSWPFHVNKSGEFIGYESMTRRGCPAVGVQLAVGYPTSFLVEASNDGFRHDLRRVHQIDVPDDASMKVELPGHGVEAFAWRIMRVGDGAAEPLGVAALRFDNRPLPEKALDQIRTKIGNVKARFHRL
jgi:hypothetical protein